MEKYILALVKGTTSSRFRVSIKKAIIVQWLKKKFTQYFPEAVLGRARSLEICVCPSVSTAAEATTKKEFTGRILRL